MPMPKRDDGLDLPDSAFAPPPEAGEDRPLELDPEWVAQRAAVQAAAAKPPKPKTSAAGVVIALVLIAAVAALIVWIVLKK